MAGKPQQPDDAALAAQEQALRDAQVDEYGTYVAVAPIDFDGVRAYNPGDPVPVSNVARHGYEAAGLVQKRS